MEIGDFISELIKLSSQSELSFMSEPDWLLKLELLSFSIVNGFNTSSALQNREEDNLITIF